MTVSPEDRFWQKVQVTDGCWLWTACLNDGGYGEFKGPFGILAHRNAWGFAHGDVPRLLDHLCHNEDSTCPGGPQCQHRRCVRLDHLHPKSKRDNAYASGRGPAMENAVKTHCVNGHPLDGDNLAIRDSGTRRRCLTCARLSKNRSMARLRAGER
jgi:hypothetical protein